MSCRIFELICAVNQNIYNSNKNSDSGLRGKAPHVQMTYWCGTIHRQWFVREPVLRDVSFRVRFKCPSIRTEDPTGKPSRSAAPGYRGRRPLPRSLWQGTVPYGYVRWPCVNGGARTVRGVRLQPKNNFACASRGAVGARTCRLGVSCSPCR